MKKWVRGLLMGSVLLVSVGVRAQAQEAQQLLLNVEKLAQLKSILEDLKRGYSVLSEGYATIKTITEGSFRLHEVFLDGLLQVSPAVRNYRRIPAIVQAQISLVKEAKTSLRQLVSSDLFSGEELRYVKAVFENVLSQGVRNIEALATVLMSGRLRLSDEERLREIDGIWKEVSEELAFLRHFNGDTKLLALARAREVADAAISQNLFSITK